MQASFSIIRLEAILGFPTLRIKNRHTTGSVPDE